MYASPDNGQTWTLRPATGLPTDLPRLGSVDLAVATDGDLYIVIVEDGAPRVFRSADGGNGFTPVVGFPTTGRNFEIEAYRNGEVLVLSGNAVHLSADDGASWRQIGPTFLSPTALRADPTSGRITAYQAQVPTGLIDGDADGVAFLGRRSIQGLLPISVRPGGALYGARLSTSDFDYLYREGTGTNGWLPMGTLHGALQSVAFGTGRHVAIDINGVIYYLDADDAQWYTRRLPPGLCLDFDLSAKQHWAVLLGTHVCVSRDGGQTWRMGISLPNTSVHSVCVSRQDGRVFLGVGAGSPAVAELDLNGSSLLKLEAIGPANGEYHVSDVDVDARGVVLASVRRRDRKDGYFAIRRNVITGFNIYTSPTGLAPGAVDRGTIEPFGYRLVNQRPNTPVEVRQYFTDPFGDPKSDFTKEFIEGSNGLDEYVTDFVVGSTVVTYFANTPVLLRGNDTIMRASPGQLPLKPYAARLDPEGRLVVGSLEGLRRSREKLVIREVN